MRDKHEEGKRKGEKTLQIKRIEIADKKNVPKNCR
jgi:hypothetical protein